jgi:hypothetical protein
LPETKHSCAAEGHTVDLIVSYLTIMLTGVLSTRFVPIRIPPSNKEEDDDDDDDDKDEEKKITHPRSRLKE